MYLDSQLQFSDTQTVTATAVATNVLDLSVDRSIGNGEPMAVLFIIESAAVQTGGDEDYTFDVEYASNAAQSTGRQRIGQRIFESGTPGAPAQNADLLVAGFTFSIPIPPTKLTESEIFLGVRYTTAGAAADVDVSAYLVPLSMIDATNDYADGFAIL